VYVSTSDAINPSLSVDDLWCVDKERAIGLIATRCLIFERGFCFIEKNLSVIDGYLLL
jgi:hypothetical protein